MPDELSAVVAGRISRLLDERGISGRSLARDTGIPSASLARKLAGTSPFDLDDLPPICRALGVSLDEILSQK